jgi:hypothetical protein
MGKDAFGDIDDLENLFFMDPERGSCHPPANDGTFTGGLSAVSNDMQAIIPLLSGTDGTGYNMTTDTHHLQLFTGRAETGVASVFDPDEVNDPTEIPANHSIPAYHRRMDGSNTKRIMKEELTLGDLKEILMQE